jgi:hypothetical protein
MESIAGSLPDLQTRKPRNSFACINRTMPMLCSRRMDWPTSAMSGGFRPPGALRQTQHILVPHLPHVGCRERSPAVDTGRTRTFGNASMSRRIRASEACRREGGAYVSCSPAQRFPSQEENPSRNPNRLDTRNRASRYNSKGCAPRVRREISCKIAGAIAAVRR